jgi:hypothetical protein
MKVSFVRIGPATALLLILAGMMLGGATPAAQKSIWLTDYDKARRLARESGKPIFVVFRCEH